MNEPFTIANILLYYFKFDYNENSRKICKKRIVDHWTISHSDLGAIIP